MLHRSLPIGLQWTPALSSAGWSHLQQAAQQTGILSSSSRNLARVDAKHIPNRHQQLRTVFQSVDVRQQPKRPRLPYLDPDGPQGLSYSCTSSNIDPTRFPSMSTDMSHARLSESTKDYRPQSSHNPNMCTADSFSSKSNFGACVSCQWWPCSCITAVSSSDLKIQL